MTLASAPDVRLVFTPAYVLLAPFCNVLDALSLLGKRQHIVVLATLVIVYAAWRVAAQFRSRPSRPGFLREVRYALRAFGVLIVVYGVGAVAQRPMAAILATDAAIVVVDFHSHTHYSLDARPDFSPSDNREWHASAGFNAAYITDHKSYDGAQAAMLGNPRLAGLGFVSLSGIELGGSEQHANALGATERTHAWASVDRTRSNSPLATATAKLRDPVLIQTLPQDLSELRAPDVPGRKGVFGIEISDGAPRGIEQTQRDRSTILRIVDSLDLAFLSGSNNHGWGRTAVAWTLMHIPGWRSLTPDSLGAAIENKIRTQRHGAARVIERRSPDPTASKAALMLTLPAVAWNMLTTLSPVERVSWLVWIIGLALLIRHSKSREWGIGNRE